MTTIFIAIAAVTGIGILCGVILVIASKVMAVEEDENFPKIRECLPGANCGSCGYPGCNEYAKALASGEEKRTNLCIPGADAVSLQLSMVLGVDFADVVEMVALPRCHGSRHEEDTKQQYQGILTCAASKIYYGGTGLCTFGCMGLGDCVAACPQDAICIVNHLAYVQTEKCIGCGLCAKACPNDLFQMIPDTAMVVVHCRNTLKGAETMKLCPRGCIGCKKCEKECPHGAIRVEDNLARIDYDKCTNCGRCAAVCPNGCISTGNFVGIHNL